MSPIAANETDLEQDPPKAPRDKSASKAKSQIAAAEAAEEIGLPQEVLRPTLPVVKARVTYLGPGDTHAVTMKGQIAQQYIEDPDGTVQLPYRERDEKTREWVVDQDRMVNYTVLKEAVDEGLTQYDFTYRDNRGQLIRDKMTPETMPTFARNRPFIWCEHIDHLRQFEMARDARGERLYYVSAPKAVMDRVAEYIKMSAKKRREMESLYDELASAGRGR